MLSHLDGKVKVHCGWWESGVPIAKGPVDPALTASKAKAVALTATVQALESRLGSAQSANLTLERRVAELEAVLAQIGLTAPAEVAKLAAARAPAAANDGQQPQGEALPTGRGALLVAVQAALVAGAGAQPGSSVPSPASFAAVSDFQHVKRKDEVNAGVERASAAVALVEGSVLPAEQESASLDAARRSAEEATRAVQNTDRAVLVSSAQLRKSIDAEVAITRDVQWGKLIGSNTAHVERLADLVRLQTNRGERKERLAASHAAGASSVVPSMHVAALPIKGAGAGEDSASADIDQMYDSRNGEFVRGSKAVLAAVGSTLQPMMAATDASCQLFINNIQAEQKLAASLLPQLEGLADDGDQIVAACVEALRLETPKLDAKDSKDKLQKARLQLGRLREADKLKRGLPQVASKVQALEDQLEDLNKQEDGLIVEDRKERRGKKRAKKLSTIATSMDELMDQKESIENEMKLLKGKTNQQLLKDYFPEVIAAADAATEIKHGAPRMPSQLTEKNLSYDDFADPPKGTERNLPGGGKAIVERKVQKSDKKDVVIKRLLDDASAANEVQHLRELRHTHVVPVLAVFRPFEWPNHVCFVMPWYEEGDIRPWVDENAGRMQSNPAVATAVRARMREIVQAVAFLHQNGVVHRDLKPENILIGDDGKL